MINTILGRDSKATPATSAANLPTPDTFNDYFTNIGPSLANRTHSEVPFSSFLPNATDNIFSLHQINESDILKLINNSRDSAPGYDHIPMWLIKRAASTLVPIITHIINLSISTGVFPHALKLAKVTPIHKSGDLINKVNFRPVSVLISLSKLFERIIYTQLMEFLTDNNILTPSQYGFRPKRSTELALVSFTKYVLDAFDNNDFVLSVFLDLSKAFDTVDHEILLSKLHHYGIRGTAHDWFSSYLSNRRQYVHVNGQSSAIQTVVCGVPQGSIIGPLLFILYINDLCRSSNTLKYILYADDTAVFTKGNNINALIMNINKELVKVSNWLASNKLTLNTSKTHFIIFHRYKKFMYPLSPVIINNEMLCETTETKFLGVTVEQHLHWRPHIESAKATIAKQCGILYLVRSSLDQQSLLLMYYTLIYPRLTYCLAVWGGASSTALNRLVIAQKRVVRNLAGLRRRDHTHDTFKTLKILKFRDIITLTNATFVYKALHAHIDCENYFRSQVNPFPTRNQANLTLPLVRSSQSQSHIRYRGVNTYNQQPSEIKNKHSLYSFKMSVKSKLLSLY